MPDWLEENDDRERAEFIRLQCRIAERVEQEFIPKDDPDRLLNQKMRNQFGDRWVKEISEIKGIGFHNEFWRGFPICEITDAHLASQKSQVRKILAASPLDFIAFNVSQEADIERLEKWELTSRGRNIIFLTKYKKQIPLYARLLKSKQLAGVKSVYFQGLFGPGLNLALTKSGHFYQLQTVEYFIKGIDNPDIDYSVLGGAKSLPCLKNVYFHSDLVVPGLQERDDIRKLASQIENVYLFIWLEGRLNDVTRLHA